MNSVYSVILTAAMALVGYSIRDEAPLAPEAPYKHLTQYHTKMPVAEPKVHAPVPEWTPTDYWCMAKNIYHEAGIESYKGKLAVGTVTMNRLDTGRWGSSVCSVVFARAQFSWTLDARLVNEQPAGVLWESSKEAAFEILSGLRVEALQHSLHYHATYVQPWWSASKKQVKQVGRHVFYHG